MKKPVTKISMKQIEEALTGWWGSRCPDYERTCVLCRTWACWDRMREFWESNEPRNG